MVLKAAVRAEDGGGGGGTVTSPGAPAEEGPLVCACARCQLQEVVIFRLVALLSIIREYAGGDRRCSHGRRRRWRWRWGRRCSCPGGGAAAEEAKEEKKEEPEEEEEDDDMGFSLFGLIYFTQYQNLNCIRYWLARRRRVHSLHMVQGCIPRL